MARDLEKKRAWDRNRPYRDRRQEHRDRYRAQNPERPQKTHCPQKHPLEGDNLYIRPSGVRECRACKVEANLRARGQLTDEQRARRRMTSRIRASERRARLRKMFVERVDPEVIFRRDEGICQICLEPVNPLDYQVDHIIPLDPGEHSYANCQLAHPLCNQRKHRKMPTKAGLGQMSPSRPLSLAS